MHTQGGHLQWWGIREPQEGLICNARLKHTTFSFIFQWFLWKVETDGKDKGIVVICLMLPRKKKTTLHIGASLLFLKGFILYNTCIYYYYYYFLNDDHTHISCLLAWQTVTYGCHYIMVIIMCSNGNDSKRCFPCLCLVLA